MIGHHITEVKESNKAEGNTEELEVSKNQDMRVGKPEAPPAAYHSQPKWAVAPSGLQLHSLTLGGHSGIIVIMMLISVMALMLKGR